MSRPSGWRFTNNESPKLKSGGLIRLFEGRLLAEIALLVGALAGPRGTTATARSATATALITATTMTTAAVTATAVTLTVMHRLLAVVGRRGSPVARRQLDFKLVDLVPLLIGSVVFGNRQQILETTARIGSGSIRGSIHQVNS